MELFQLYSKRQKKLRGEFPDIYQYEDFPHPFRVQVVHIWRGAFGTRFVGTDCKADEAFQLIHDTLCREYGRFRLLDKNEDANTLVSDFVLSTVDTEQILDVIELSFRVIDKLVRENQQWFHRPRLTPDEAIAELNERFQEHGLGYQYTSGEIIRVDSKLIHSEVVKPALLLLQGKSFAGANEEFLRAHEHYRHKRYKDCLNECLKAFESTMKAICKKRNWNFSETSDTSKRLIEICLEKGLIPPYWQSHFTGVRATLESGVPTARNRTSGHGQGVDLKEVPLSLAAYVLHLTAATLLFLIEAEQELS